MPPTRPWLLVVAAPKEAQAVAEGLSLKSIPGLWGLTEGPRACIVRSGVGKWAAAGAVARWYNAERFAGVLCIGVCGSFPSNDGRDRGQHPPLGSVLLADPSVMADEGVQTPSGFLGLDAIGFAEDAAPVRPDDASRRALTPLADAVGPIATVSACSGTRAGALAVAGRTGAIAEAMEGAACGLAARRLNPNARFAELRVVSNTTGDRDAQVWDLSLALRRMTEVLGPALTALGG